MSKSVNKSATKKPSPKTASKPRQKYQLTVGKDKIAILLRLPKTAVKIIDHMAKVLGDKRTSVIYRIIANDPRLSESMQTLLPKE